MRPVTPETREIVEETGGLLYDVTAPMENCRLLSEGERVFPVPAMKKGYPGISASFFPNERAAPEWIAEVRRYIQTWSESTHGPILSERRERICELYVRNRNHVKELKALYEGWCQVSGKPVLNGLAGDITEVHHIVWLTRGGLDTKDNMVVISPDIHAAIHATDAAFDWNTLSFNINGQVLPLTLNKHLKAKDSS